MCKCVRNRLEGSAHDGNRRARRSLFFFVFLRHAVGDVDERRGCGGGVQDGDFREARFDVETTGGLGEVQEEALAQHVFVDLVHLLGHEDDHELQAADELDDFALLAPARVSLSYGCGVDGGVFTEGAVGVRGSGAHHTSHTSHFIAAAVLS